MTAVVHKKTDATKFLTDLCIGGLSASVSKTVVAPIERVKLLLQVQASHKDIAVDKRYKGIIDVLVRVPKEQGFLSFWRGNMTNVARYFPTQNFFSYSARSMASGGLAGCTSLCFVYPLDFLRTRLSVDVSHNKNREYKGLIDCASKTVKSEGVATLYRGFFISLQTYFIYRSVYFGLYDAIRHSINPDKKSLPFYTSFAIAQGVTVCSAYLTYPWDTVRRRMMTKGHLSSSKAFSAAKKIFLEEGIQGLYRGALANIFRSAGGALVMALYEEVHKHI